jgi:hypothetical protein
MAVITGVKKPEPVQIKGRNGAGAIPLAGATAGSAVFGCVNIQTGANQLASFESVISISGQIQQVATSDLSGAEFWVYTIG